MKALGWFGTAFVILCLVSCSGKDSKDGAGDGNKDSGDNPKPQTNAEKIIGTWKVVKSKVDTGNIISFARDGTATFRDSEKTRKEEKGTFRIEGDTLTTTLGTEPPHPTTIKSLTDTKLVLIDPEDGEGELEKQP
jgi:uncharacterized protein (TIGR03066 family)